MRILRMNLRAHDDRVVFQCEYSGVRYIQVERRKLR
jgi:hypothetical protein